MQRTLVYQTKENGMSRWLCCSDLTGWEPELIPSLGGHMYAGRVPAHSIRLVHSCVAGHAQLQVEEGRRGFLTWREVAEEQRVQVAWLTAQVCHPRATHRVMFASIQMVSMRVPSGLGITDMSMMPGTTLMGMPRAVGPGPSSVDSRSVDRITLAAGFQTVDVGTSPSTPAHQWIKLIDVLFCSWCLLVISLQV